MCFALTNSEHDRFAALLRKGDAEAPAVGSLDPEIELRAESTDAAQFRPIPGLRQRRGQVERPEPDGPNAEKALGDDPAVESALGR